MEKKQKWEGESEGLMTQLVFFTPTDEAGGFRDHIFHQLMRQAMDWKGHRATSKTGNGTAKRKPSPPKKPKKQMCNQPYVQPTTYMYNQTKKKTDVSLVENITTGRVKRSWYGWNGLNGLKWLEMALSTQVGCHIPPPSRLKRHWAGSDAVSPVMAPLG